MVAVYTVGFLVNYAAAASRFLLPFAKTDKKTVHTYIYIYILHKNMKLIS